MSTRVADTLPAELLERLSARNLDAVADKVIVICSVDDRGFPHPALLSYFEMVALDAGTIRIALYNDSRTAGNVRRDGRLTLVVVDAHVAYYIKGTVSELARSMRATPYNAKLDLKVVDVLVDQTNPELEPEAYIASGITYVNPRRAQELERARRILAELQE